MNVDEELLVITMEECSEVAKACSKLIRFGNEDFCTDDLQKEIGDLICLFDMMSEREWISWDKVHEQACKKQEKLKIWSNLCED